MTPEQEKEAEKFIMEAVHLRRSLTPQQKELSRVFLKQLIHFRDTSVGHWVTDKPKSVDEKKLFFQLQWQ